LIKNEKPQKMPSTKGKIQGGTYKREARDGHSG